MAQNRLLLLALLLIPFIAEAQLDLITPFKNCPGSGSTTIYDNNRHQWIYSDSLDAQKATLPASTFKVINLLIALETNVIRDEHEVVKWVGKVDTVLYGNRPEIYHDMSIKEAFEVSAGWVFIELAKRVGRDRYRKYLTKCHYGNDDLSEAGTDFWNFGSFGISPINQINFLRNAYSGEVPFSRRNLTILKRVMVTEKGGDYTIRSKTGWTRDGGNDTGWWVGYVEKNGNIYFFATRLIKSLQVSNPNFGPCRKEITRTILHELKAI
ncbi:penicillin-binding transpeptidase domain-containing protein [Spirosoma pollinicola]|uniref:beta-lactamase n=1 Tax=Spirosoma pollinicola TaxID=2057025 RepID=A0A2K8Z809_9BACT|nr:penicillin-binding transpeptidase domain-containing protein [Spirosoma pollinicola]AUD05984.1 penicillin binding protein transpeptidase domain-containing protein [Spirosoma pollinicola]